MYFDNKYFKFSELECRDGTSALSDIDTEALEKLIGLRQFHGKPMTINSGHRSVAYSKENGYSVTSAHTKGKAFDIRVRNDKERFALLHTIFAAIEHGYHYAPQRVGIANGFIHVDWDYSKTQEVAWLY